MHFKKLSPHLVALIAFVVFISVSSLAYILIPTNSKTPTTLVQPLSPLTTKVITLPSTTISNVKINATTNEQTLNKINSTTTVEISTTTDTNTILFSLRILDTEINSAVKIGTNVIEAMKKLQAENKISFSGKEFSNLGFFINTINGQSEDTTKGLYWFMYINGQSSNIGASQYIIKANDQIEWKLKKSNF